MLTHAQEQKGREQIFNLGYVVNRGADSDANGVSLSGNVSDTIR